MYSRSTLVAKVVSGMDELERASTAVGDVLITARVDAYDSPAFAKRLKSFTTHILYKMFPLGLKVVTRSEYGRLHCHAAVGLDFPTDGFDWESFDQAERWYNIYKMAGGKEALKWYKFYTKTYRASMPPELRRINQELQKRARAYGFGHVFCLPVKRNLEALKWYLVKNIPKKRPKRDKYLHYFESWGIQKLGKFKVLTPQYNEYRRKLKLFAEGLHLDENNYNIVLRDILGNNWHWRCRDYIKDIAMLPEGLHLPASLKNGYEELGKTVKQHLIRIGQYAP